METSDHTTLKNLKSRGYFWALGQDQEKRFRFEIIREFVQKVRQVTDSTPETQNHFWKFVICYNDIVVNIAYSHCIQCLRNVYSAVQRQ